MPNGFSKELRLRSNTEFQRHFKRAPKKFTHSHFVMLVVRNDYNVPRLGVILSKKNIPQAVDRNRIKRLIRESFRFKQRALPAVDIVVIGRRGMQNENNTVLREKLEKKWKEIINFFSENKTVS